MKNEKKFKLENLAKAQVISTFHDILKAAQKCELRIYLFITLLSLYPPLTLAKDSIGKHSTCSRCSAFPEEGSNEGFVPRELLIRGSYVCEHTKLQGILR